MDSRIPVPRIPQGVGAVSPRRACRRRGRLVPIATDPVRNVWRTPPRTVSHSPSHSFFHPVLLHPFPLRLASRCLFLFSSRVSGGACRENRRERSRDGRKLRRTGRASKRHSLWPDVRIKLSVSPVLSPPPLSRPLPLPASFLHVRLVAFRRSRRRRVPLRHFD